MTLRKKSNRQIQNLNLSGEHPVLRYTLFGALSNSDIHCSERYQTQIYIVRSVIKSGKSLVGHKTACAITGSQEGTIL